MGAAEFAPEIRKRYQTNELVVDSTEFGTSGPEETSSRLPCPRAGFPRTLISNFRRLDLAHGR
jgi:hypothetical protein